MHRYVRERHRCSSRGVARCECTQGHRGRRPGHGAGCDDHQRRRDGALHEGHYGYSRRHVGGRQQSGKLGHGRHGHAARCVPRQGEGHQDGHGGIGQSADQDLPRCRSDLRPRDCAGQRGHLRDGGHRAHAHVRCRRHQQGWDGDIRLHRTAHRYVGRAGLPGGPGGVTVFGDRMGHARHRRRVDGCRGGHHPGFLGYDGQLQDLDASHHLRA